MPENVFFFFNAVTGLLRLMRECLASASSHMGFIRALRVAGSLYRPVKSFMAMSFIFFLNRKEVLLLAHRSGSITNKARLLSPFLVLRGQPTAAVDFSQGPPYEPRQNSLLDTNELAAAEQD